MARPKEYDEQEVVAQAVELFRRRGYEGTSVRDLLEHTGLSSSSLYAAFGGKEALFVEALRAHAAVEREQLHAQLTAPGGLRANLRAVFDDLIAELVDSENASSLTLRAAVEQAASMPPVFQLLSDYVQELTTMLADRLDAAHRTGELHLAHPAADVAHFLLFSAYSLGFVAKIDRSRERLLAFTDVTLSVLDAPAPGGSR